jgi:hypothetical protein
VSPEAVHGALELRADVPVVRMDARVPDSGFAMIVRLVEHALGRS